MHTELVLEVADLPAHRRLRDVKFPGGSAQDVFSLCHSDEITKMPKFHCRSNYAATA
jgi:hypothetical protein